MSRFCRSSSLCWKASVSCAEARSACRCRYVAFSDSICSVAVASCASASCDVDAVRRVVEPIEQVAALHGLVVVHGQLDDATGHVGADRGASRHDIGVLGLLVAAAAHIEVRGQHESDDGPSHEQRQARSLPAIRGRLDDGSSGRAWTSVAVRSGSVRARWLRVGAATAGRCRLQRARVLVDVLEHFQERFAVGLAHAGEDLAARDFADAIDLIEQRCGLARQIQPPRAPVLRDPGGARASCRPPSDRGCAPSSSARRPSARTAAPGLRLRFFDRCTSTLHCVSVSETCSA